MWFRKRAGEYQSGSYRILRGDLANEEQVGPVPVPKASWVLWLDAPSRALLCGTLRQAMDEADILERLAS